MEANEDYRTVEGDAAVKPCLPIECPPQEEFEINLTARRDPRSGKWQDTGIRGEIAGQVEPETIVIDDPVNDYRIRGTANRERWFNQSHPGMVAPSRRTVRGSPALTVIAWVSVAALTIVGLAAQAVMLLFLWAAVVALLDVVVH